MTRSRASMSIIIANLTSGTASRPHRGYHPPRGWGGPPATANAEAGEAGGRGATSQGTRIGRRVLPAQSENSSTPPWKSDRHMSVLLGGKVCQGQYEGKCVKVSMRESVSRSV